MDDAFVEELVSLIHRLSADTPSPRAPSSQECRFCDIGPEDCPERIDQPAAERETADF